MAKSKTMLALEKGTQERAYNIGNALFHQMQARSHYAYAQTAIALGDKQMWEMHMRDVAYAHRQATEAMLGGYDYTVDLFVYALHSTVTVRARTYNDARYKATNHARKLKMNLRDMDFRVRPITETI